MTSQRAPTLRYRAPLLQRDEIFRRKHPHSLRLPTPSPLFFSHSLSSAPGEIVQEAWDSTCLQKRYAGKVKALRLQLEVASNIPRVAFLDAGRARQVIANLVGNSLKFTGPGGSVTVVAEFIEEERQLSVRVVDTGAWGRTGQGRGGQGRNHGSGVTGDGVCPGRFAPAVAVDGGGSSIPVPT